MGGVLSKLVQLKRITDGSLGAFLVNVGKFLENNSHFTPFESHYLKKLNCEDFKAN